jgi:hypothetical protein
MADKEESKSITEPVGDKTEATDKQAEKARQREAKIKRGARRSGYVAAIVVDVILLIVVNNLLAWGVPFLTHSFYACLWAINLSLAVSIIGNAVLLAYNARWFRHVIQIVLDIFALIAIYVVYVIFPFAFPQVLWVIVAKIALIIAIVGVVVGLIVEFVKLVLNRD